jgi:hypothetical protein
MEYQKPELNQLGSTESLILGVIEPGDDSNTQHSEASSAFEFEE